MINLDIKDKTTNNPQTLILFGPPKIGKTTKAAELTLKRNWLLVDLEEKDGSDYVEGRKIKLKEWAEANDKAKLPEWQQFYFFLKDLEENKESLEGAIFDNLSIIQEYAKAWALADALKDPKFKGMIKNFKWDGKELYNIPEGMGYGLARARMLEFKKLIEKACHHVIYIGHVVNKNINKMVDGDEIIELNVNEIDLVGKLKRIFTQYVSATGYVYRKENEVHVSFKCDPDIVDSGSRVPELNNYQGVLDWSKIYK